MTTVREGPCAPWTTRAAVLALPTVARLDPPPSDALVDQMIDVASWVLYERTGRRWPGVCTTTVVWSPGAVASRCVPRSRHGGARTALPLGYFPVHAVSAVTVDGDALVEADTWELRSNRWLLRLDDVAWAGDVEVTFTHGASPPEMGALAATVLAAELVLGHVADGACRLPSKVQSYSRQNISVAMVDPAAFFTHERIGLPEVDLFLTSLRQPANGTPPRVITARQRPGLHRS